jgi:hypothetical protein
MSESPDQREPPPESETPPNDATTEIDVGNETTPPEDPDEGSLPHGENT